MENSNGLLLFQIKHIPDLLHMPLTGAHALSGDALQIGSKNR